MKKTILIYLYCAMLGAPIFYYDCIVASIMYECDMSDYILQPLCQESLHMWSLLDLAENSAIVDRALFYDQLCQTALRICAHAQHIYDNRHILSHAKIAEHMYLCKSLHEKFSHVSADDEDQKSYCSAIDIILRYSYVFLKNNMGIYPDRESA